jgi:hypothetical protein
MDHEKAETRVERELRLLREENAMLRQEAADKKIRPYLNEEEDEVIGWLYRPHTMTGLLVLIAVPIFVSVKIHSHLDQSDRMMRDRLGLLSVVSAFLGYCAFQMRDSILIRPHPMFWRMIHGMGILYLLFMIYLLNMDIGAARSWIRTFSPELKNQAPPPENTRIYATDCRIGTAGDPRGPFYVFWDTSFDIFFVAHFVGWIGKAIVFRDMKLTLTLSVMWEVVEYSFQHILGNFHECWWDHWILDVGLANLGGLLVGLFINHRYCMGCMTVWAAWAIFHLITSASQPPPHNAPSTTGWRCAPTTGRATSPTDRPPPPAMSPLWMSWAAFCSSSPRGPGTCTCLCGLQFRQLIPASLSPASE